MKRSFWARRILLFILIAAVAILLFGTVIMLLWNNVLAQVVNVSTITFVQALGILVLSKILFGGFRGGWGPRRHYWKQRMMQKWDNMTPEEREKFKQEWKGRCSGWGSWSERTSSEKSGAGSQMPGSHDADADNYRAKI
jgi:Ca2+/H+ antiporter, TMEM165/GDT1 family